MQYKFPASLYTKDVLFKAAYNYTDSAYIHLDFIDDYYIVDIEMKNSDLSISEKEFQNELVAQMVRKNVRNQTRNIRELMLARAFASTIIEDDTLKMQETSEFEEVNINDILKDWFEQNND